MKHLPAFLGLTAALCLSLPATGLSRDHHHGRGDSHHYSSNSRYCAPSVSYRSSRPYGYGYRSYGSSYSYSGYPYGYSSYYARPSFGVTLSTGPSYATYTRTTDSSDDLAVDVQRALARRGFYRGSIDGDVGAGTRSAIREYQYRNRLEVTGRIDRSLLRALDLS